MASFASMGSGCRSPAQRDRRTLMRQTGKLVVRVLNQLSRRRRTGPDQGTVSPKSKGLCRMAHSAVDEAGALQTFVHEVRNLS